VLLGKRVGFSLAEIRGLLDLYDLSSGKVKQPHVALRKFDAQLRAFWACTESGAVIRG
jgi:hypothetical protein